MTLSEQLSALVPPGSRLRFGELVLVRNAEGSYSARHVSDEAAGTPLEVLDSVCALRELAKFDAKGAYRPLKTAPGLRRGWITSTTDPREFLNRLDALYPGLFATWIAFDSGNLAPVPLRETLDRQTGMYRFAGSISDEMANRILTDLCGSGCLRRVAWTLRSESPPVLIQREPGEIPLVCTEACTFAVTRARELAKEAHESQSASPPRG